MNESVLNIYELREGDELPEMKKSITQDAIDRYAEASGDYNPIHIDTEFAAATPLGGTIAHGMLVLAYMTQMVEGVFGVGWGAGGSLNVRFRSPARPGDTLTIGGKVRKISDSDTIRRLACEVRCCNQQGDTVLSGEVTADIARPQKSQAADTCR